MIQSLVYPVDRSTLDKFSDLLYNCSRVTTVYPLSLVIPPRDCGITQVRIAHLVGSASTHASQDAAMNMGKMFCSLCLARQKSVTPLGQHLLNGLHLVTGQKSLTWHVILAVCDQEVVSLHSVPARVEYPLEVEQ